MGANAQTSVPAFTAGQVLTAQQQTEINTGIPVFATTTTRDAAFGGTGEKVLAEGQFAYIEASNTTQYYDGAAWQTVGPTPGLQYITGASFTTATSFILPANTFSATYRNYKMLIQLTASTSDATFTARLRASGTDNSTSSYFTMFQGIDNSGNARGNTGSGQTSFNMGQTDSTSGNVRNTYSLDIISPQVAEITYLLGQMTWVDTAGTWVAGFAGGAMFTGTTQFDSLSFISSVASSITGVYRVYGYSES